MINRVSKDFEVMFKLVKRNWQYKGQKWKNSKSMSIGVPFYQLS